MDGNFDLQDLWELAWDTRELFARVLQNSLGTTSTRGTCAYASVVRGSTVGKLLPCETVVRGGDGTDDGGYFDLAGRGHGHYWVEVRAAGDPGRAWVVDITADQFGGPQVVVVDMPAAGRSYRPGRQDLVDEGLAELLAGSAGAGG